VQRMAHDEVQYAERLKKKYLPGPFLLGEGGKLEYTGARRQLNRKHVVLLSRIKNTAETSELIKTIEGILLSDHLDLAVRHKYANGDSQRQSDILFYMWKAIQSYDPDRAPLRPFLYICVSRGLSGNVFRKKRSNVSLDDIEYEFEGPKEDYIGERIVEEEIAGLQKAIADLPDKHRPIMNLYAQGFQLKDMVVMLGNHKATISHRKKKAMKMLRKKLSA